MEVSTKPITEKSQVELTITVTPEELETYLDRAAKQLSKDRPIKGFRPGKVPVSTAIDNYGTETVLSAALEKAIPRWFVQAVLENNIDALGRPSTSINKASLEEGVSFTATVDILPTIQLGDPTQIKITKRPVSTTNKDVVQELNALAKSRSTFIDVARPAEKGDTVIIDFDVSMDGVPMEGGSSKNHPVNLGEGHFIPDFEEKLQGIQAGDERDIQMTFPADFANEDLRGKTATAKVKAHEVKKRIIPVLNDEFAQKIGKFKNLDHLKSELKKNIQHERQHKEEDRVASELSEKLAEISTFGSLPQSLIEREIDRRIGELTQMLAYQQKTIEDYLKQTGKTGENLRQEFLEPAQHTVKVSLALRQFAQEQSIEPSEEEIEVELQNALKYYKDVEQAQQEINEETLKDNIQSTLRHQQALKKLEELAEIKQESNNIEEKDADKQDIDEKVADKKETSSQ